MLYKEIIAVCSEIHRKHINALWGQNVEFLGAFANSRKATMSFFMRLVCIWEQRAIISLYSINWLVFITEI